VLHGVVSIGASTQNRLGSATRRLPSFNSNQLCNTSPPRFDLSFLLSSHNAPLPKQGWSGRRRIQPTSAGEIVPFPEVACLYDRYEPRAAWATTDRAIASRDSSFSAHGTGNARRGPFKIVALDCHRRADSQARTSFWAGTPSKHPSAIVQWGSHAGISNTAYRRDTQFLMRYIRVGPLLAVIGFESPVCSLTSG